MTTKKLSGTALEKALKEGTLAQTNVSLTGMVKPSEKSGYISFALGNCDSWVDLPTDMIDSAEQVALRSCRDHSHPTMRITLKEPKESEGKILLALLEKVTQKPSTESLIDQSHQGSGFQDVGMLAQALAMRPGVNKPGINKGNCTSICVWLNGGINPDGSIDVGVLLRCLGICSDIFDLGRGINIRNY